MNIKDMMRIMMPDFWLMNYKYNAKWDKILNANIEKGIVTRVDFAECVVGDVRVWVSNFPYGYGTPYTTKMSGLPRPSRKTILKLRKHIESILGKESKNLEDEFIDAAIVKS